MVSRSTLAAVRAQATAAERDAVATAARSLRGWAGNLSRRGKDARWSHEICKISHLSISCSHAGPCAPLVQHGDLR